MKIFTTPESGGEMNSVDSVSAVEGRGLMGDRYYSLSGTFSKPEIEPDQEVSLIELEAFEELKQDHAIELDYSQSRRNILTRGVDLNSLVGKTFTVGEVTLTGIRLCEPCAYLSGLTGHPKLVKQWLHRAGLRAQIRKSGKIQVNDKIII
ncbi:MAG: MOSC domain-containing protein [Acidiferrobacterales bacterium]|nr:MOSC domain-containing protein [Acidiferrobacterales bacterium]